ncbi:MAG: response regulator [Desulfobacteraceae bacterium]|jgi:signal transduction histidine kinase
MEDQVIRVLLVEDDEDDYVIVRDFLSEIEGQEFELDWVSTYHGAMEKAASNRHDICLMDYRLGERDGIQLTRDFQRHGFQAPIILLTGLGSHDVDTRAMREGAVDYLEKGDLNPKLLERSIRYAIDHARTLAALRESERQLRVLSSKILEAQESERKIIAQELHDSIGASLTAIRYGLEEKLHRMGKESRPPEGISLEQLISIVRDTIDEAHRISSNLRPSALDDMGLLAAIRSICREFEEIHEGIKVGAQIDVREEDVQEPLKIVVYRVLQESLNNVLKHSGAEAVRVNLTKTEKFLELSISDDGHGFDAGDKLSSKGEMVGMGLLGMKERTELSNGTFEIASEKGKGTVVTAKWPVNQ